MLNNLIMANLDIYLLLVKSDLGLFFIFLLTLLFLQVIFQKFYS